MTERERNCIEALANAPADLCLRSPIPAGAQILAAKSEITETDDGRRMVKLSFDPSLISMLENQHDIRCDRKTVYSDIAALMDYGVDIVSIPGKNGGYYIASGHFELPELKLLIDAVQSSRYLTAKKSRQLIEKLCKLCDNR